MESLRSKDEPTDGREQKRVSSKRNDRRRDYADHPVEATPDDDSGRTDHILDRGPCGFSRIGLVDHR